MGRRIDIPAVEAGQSALCKRNPIIQRYKLIQHITNQDYQIIHSTDLVVPGDKLFRRLRGLDPF